MDYLFSVIVVISKPVDRYEESLRSIFEQSIGFNENIQLIMVDMCCDETTVSFCREYAKMYPDNVEYYRFGESDIYRARNEGIEKVRGKYVVLFDCSGKWGADAFNRIRTLMSSSGKKADVCCCKMENEHQPDIESPVSAFIDYSDDVVDLREADDGYCASTNGLVFSGEAIRDVRYDTELDYGQDAYFINNVLLKKLTIAVCRDAVYYNRIDYSQIALEKDKLLERDWYLEVPEKYYLRMINHSKEMKGQLPLYTQRLILFDIATRLYDPKVETILSKEEMQQYLNDMRRVFAELDDYVMPKGKSTNQINRLYWFYLKYGEDLFSKIKVEGNKLALGDVKIFSFSAKTAIRVDMLTFKDGKMILDGIVCNNLLGRVFPFYIKNGKNEKIDPELQRYESSDERGYKGEYLTKGERFLFQLPCEPEETYSFHLMVDNVEMTLKPWFAPVTGLSRKHNAAYVSTDEIIVKYSNRKLRVYRNEKIFSLKSKIRYNKQLKREDDRSELDDWKASLAIERMVEKAGLKPQVAFISVRNRDLLEENMQRVFDQIESKKVAFSQMKIKDDPHVLKKVAEIVYHSQVVVTDDYLYLLMKYGKAQGQKVIQLWHAAGAFKKFGLDGTSLFPGKDAAYHKDYDLVAVSSEGVRDIYAGAFGIPVDRVKALGVPRTDSLLDEDNKKNVKKKILRQHPELGGKEIILYAPTFRDLGNVGRELFVPDIDFDLLSESLHSDQMFVIAPHPVMTEDILHKEYDNIKEIRDINSNDLMFITDLLITDYSSVIFDFSLLNKPILFYCYDYDEYNRDFYLDFEHELPGDIVKTQDEFLRYIKRHNYEVDEKMASFRKKYMGACDGHSTERIAMAIDKMLRNI